MGTDVMTPGRTRTGSEPAEPRRVTPGRPDPDARRPARPGRRPRPDRPASPVPPAGPVRPASPLRPAGPGRPGRPIRTGPARHQHQQPRPAIVRPAVGALGGQPAATARPAGRTSFVVLVLGLLAGGLMCLLVVNTTLAANSMEISRLQHANSARTERIQQLQQLVTADQSAAVIARKARQLGMVPLSQLTFLDLRTHSIKVGKGATR